MDENATDFENLILNELVKAWRGHAFKFGWMKAGLQPPQFRVFDNQDRWGQWTADKREMSFSRSLIHKRPWNEVIEVLKHEMAHQYVSEILHITDEPPHGVTFQNVCKNNQIDAAPRGVPGANKIDAVNHIVEKVRHLLELAKSDNENEARNAAETAHKMMLKYNIDLQEKNEQKGYTVRYLGEITGRIQKYTSQIAHLLSKFYFVEIIWIQTYDPRTKKKGHELEISGTEENVEAAEYIYDFLSRAAVESWKKKFDDPAFKLELHKEFAQSFGMHNGAPQSVQGFTVSARSNYLLGFIRGFESQLKQAEIQEQQAGLVLAKDIELENFYHTRHPHIRQLAKSNGFYNPNMRNKGYAEGAALQVTPGMKANKKYTPLLGK